MNDIKMYLKKLKEYSNRYDYTFMNQIYAQGGAEEILLSDIYADFELVSKEDYDQVNGKGFNLPFNLSGIGSKGSHFSGENYENSLDIDAMIMDIDKKIYELTVKDEMEKPHTVVKKKAMYVFIKRIDKDGNMECLTKDNFASVEETERVIKVIDESHIAKKVKKQWCWIRGYEVVDGESSTFIVEPYWYRTEEMLSEMDRAFLDSDIIIERDSAEKKRADNLDATLSSKSPLNDVQNGRDSTIAGTVVISEPGGGKTTFLKHLIYKNCEHALSKIYDEAALVSEDWHKGILDLNKIYIPIFIRTRDIAERLESDEISDDLFEILLEDGVYNVLRHSDSAENDENNSDTIDVRNIIRAINDEVESEDNIQLLLVIDGFEELSDEAAEVLLSCIMMAYELKKIDANNDRLIISSRYKEYGFQKLVEFCAEHSIDEKYIAFNNENEAINDCISKWFAKFQRNSESNYDYFKRTYSSNSDIRNMIHTPLELTGLIMICQSQSALPTDITILYRLIMEIWLTYAVRDDNSEIPFISMSDIFLELSLIAYAMAEYEDDKLKITRDRIYDIIRKSRENLRRYYRSNSYVNANSNSELGQLLDFWQRRNIFVINSRGDVYEFAHREYQSYLISLAIVNNLILTKDGSKSSTRDRLDYFKNHMERAEDFWDRVIVFSAFMSPDIHDSIIGYIFEELKKYKDINNTIDSRRVDRYYLSLLLQLTNAEGFYFADEEYDELFDAIFAENTDRIKLLKKSAKGSEFKKLLSNGRKETNTSFLEKSISSLKFYDDKIKELDSAKNTEEKDKTIRQKADFIDAIGNIIFHVVWKCEAEEDVLKKAFTEFLGNWITMDIAFEIKNSIENNSYIEKRINLIRECGRAAIKKEKDPITDCYMIITLLESFIKAKEENKTLYQVALDYFEMAQYSADEIEKNEASIIAINIMLLTTWFIRCDDASKIGCALKENGVWNEVLLNQYRTCLEKLVEYVKQDNNKKVYSRDLQATYRDICMINDNEFAEKVNDIVFAEDVLLNCLHVCEVEGIAKGSDEKELTYVCEAIASYPLNDETMKIFERDDVKAILDSKIEEIKELFDKEMLNDKTLDEQSFNKVVFLLKLLIFAGNYGDKEKAEVELKNQIRKIKRRMSKTKENKDAIIQLQHEVSAYFNIFFFDKEHNGDDDQGQFNKLMDNMDTMISQM